MRLQMGGSQLLWYTFALILAYLVLRNYTGANTLLRSSFSGYTGAVRVLQGR